MHTFFIYICNHIDSRALDFYAPVQCWLGFHVSWVYMFLPFNLKKRFCVVYYLCLSVVLLLLKPFPPPICLSRSTWVLVLGTYGKEVLIAAMIETSVCLFFFPACMVYCSIFISFVKSLTGFLLLEHAYLNHAQRHRERRYQQALKGVQCIEMCLDGLESPI